MGRTVIAAILLLSIHPAVSFSDDGVKSPQPPAPGMSMEQARARLAERQAHASTRPSLEEEVATLKLQIAALKAENAKLRAQLAGTGRIPSVAGGNSESLISKIQKGMTYDQAIGVLGKPATESRNSDGDVTTTWRRMRPLQVIREGGNTQYVPGAVLEELAVMFKDGVVQSFEDQK